MALKMLMRKNFDPNLSISDYLTHYKKSICQTTNDLQNVFIFVLAIEMLSAFFMSIGAKFHSFPVSMQKLSLEFLYLAFSFHCMVEVAW